MLALLPTIISAGAAAVKLGSGSGSGDAAKTAAGDSTGTAGSDSSNTPSSSSEFQNLLNAQTAHAGQTAQGAQPAQTAQSVDASKQPFGFSPDLLANLKTDGDATPGQPMRGRSAADKSAETALAAAPAAAPGNDLATLIGASAAAGTAAAGHAALALANTAGGKNAKAGDTAATLTAIDTGRGANAALPSAASAAAAVTAGADPHGGAVTVAGAQNAATPAFDNNATIAALQAAIQNSVTAPAAKEHAAADIATATGANALPQSLSAAGNNAPATNTTVPSGQIDMPVGSQGWDQALGQRVVWMVSQKDQTAEIHVNPPELGPLSVTVNVNNNTASASFVAAHAATRDAINDAMPKLRDMFADAGINLGQVSVSAESFSQGGHNAGQAWQGRPDAGGASGAGSSAAAASAVQPLRTSRAQIGMVDTFA